MSFKQIFKWSDKDIGEAHEFLEIIREDSMNSKKDAGKHKSISYKLYVGLRNICFISLFLGMIMYIFSVRTSIMASFAYLFNTILCFLFIFHEKGDYSEKWRITMVKQFNADKLADCLALELEKEEHNFEWSSFSNSLMSTRNEILSK